MSARVEKLSQSMIEVEEAVKYGFADLFRVGKKFLGSSGMADRVIGRSAKTRKSIEWIVAERMFYAKITEHVLRVDRVGKISHIDGRV